jgi:hypothetical protein
VNIRIARCRPHQHLPDVPESQFCLGFTIMLYRALAVQITAAMCAAKSEYQARSVTSGRLAPRIDLSDVHRERPVANGQRVRARREPIGSQLNTDVPHAA